MKTVAAAVLAALILAGRARAADDARLGELERKVDALTEELERLKLGEASEPPAADSKPGLAPASSKVYFAKPSKVSIGGYGELVYTAPSSRKQNGDSSKTKKQLDLRRAVLYFGYKYNDWILFNSEVEFEHAGTGEGDEKRGEVGVEQAYLDFRLREEFGVRAGHVVVPLGLVNEVHEPTAFYGVNRPSVETFIIPSTWHENGVGVFGEAGPVSYRTYLLGGLHAVKTDEPATDGFTGASGIRGARAEGSNGFAEDLAWAGRLDFGPWPGVKAGAAAYVGRADQRLLAASVPVTLWEAHVALERRGASLKALYAEGRVGNVDALNAAQGFTDANKDSVGRRLFGGYVEAAFDVLTLAPRPAGQSLSPFVRWERYDTQWRTPNAYSKDPANSRVEYTLGAVWKPIPQVAVKADQQWKRNQARTGVNQWNLGLAYIF